MLNRLIQLSLANRGLVLAAAAVVLGLGVFATLRLPVEVLPDLTKPTVTIMTEAPGLAPEEVETLITVPIENALMGVSGLTRLRSTSDVSLSLVFVEFDWGTDIHRARTLVRDRLQGAVEFLPEDIPPPYMTPIASLMGEIMLVGIRSTDGKIEPRDLRTYADWEVRRRFQSINGVAEALSMGGGVKQIHVQPDPDRMLAMGVTFEELRDAAAEAASNATGGYLDSGSQEIMVRILAMTTDLDAIGRTVIKNIDDRPITIADVANVDWDVAPMRGDAAVDGTPGVIVNITKSPGFDTLRLTKEVEEAISELQETAPEGVEIVGLFRQADFINHAIGNLEEAILVGGALVVVVLFLFLLNVRTTFITLMAIPLSFTTTALVFWLFEISVNSMTLGGLAVAIGMVVDDAIVDVENVFRRLRERAAMTNPPSRLETIASASREVRHSILYATILIILVFVPLLFLTGVAGRLFSPIAIATIVSIAASFVVSLTVIPVLCSILLRPKEGKKHKDGVLVFYMKWFLRKTWLMLAIEAPFFVMGFAALLLAYAVAQYPTMGKNFLPEFNEETILVAMTASPGTSLKQTNELADIADEILKTIPEIRKVGRRVGRAERGDHIVPVSTIEFDIDFDFSIPNARSRTKVVDEIRTKTKQIPGTFAAINGPLKDRVGHMLSGVAAPIAVKISGPDLGEIRRLGLEIQKVAKEIPGLEEAKIEQQAPIPQLRIEIDRDRALAYGITPGELNEQLSAMIGGEVVNDLQEEQRSIDLVVRLDKEFRESPENLADMYLDTGSGQRIPLGLLADLREATGPNVIQRENTKRRFVVSIRPTARDLAGLVERLEREVKAKVERPEGYSFSFEGEYEAQLEATRRIAILCVVIFVVLAFLLNNYFKTPVFAAQVLFDIPLALIGGIIFTKIELDNISIASLVGFIAVAGIAARNSIMLISHYLHLMRHEGEGFTREMIIRGTQERLVPVLMTALSAGIALLPLVAAEGQPGKEILNPVACVIVGGLITSTFLGLGVTPAVFWTFGKKAAQNAIDRNAAATG
ncbi:MAG: efflux RND transporter permease subunit [Verrucomicrobiales bacterium]|nr:efflux RND transporter permease subunit [Verrucomicrobiales bacterium]